MRKSFSWFVVAISVFGLACAPAEAQERKNIWSGVFNSAQAERGEAAFLANCARCHLEDLSGKNGPPLKGDRFFEDWRESNLGILFSTVKSMPPNSRRTPVPRLPENTSLDILTHILKVNGAPTGAQELTVEALPSVQFEKKTGPEPVPNLVTVRVTGCLSQSSPTAWALTSATEPVRAMDAEVLSPLELDAARSSALGTNSFRLSQIDYIEKPITTFKDRRVVVKGMFVRADNGTRINLTAMDVFSGPCQP